MSQTPGPARYYNVIAGQSLDRLSGLSDGIFSVGMTLLVLGLAVPLATGISGEGDLALALAQLLPNAVTYAMSFLTLGIFWVAQQTQFSQLARSDRNFTWVHIGFLLAVTLVPFSTGLLAHFITFRLALLVYWLNIVILGFVLLAGAEYALRANLFQAEGEGRRAVIRVIRRRVLIAQALYAVATALCVFNTFVSIALIVLIQLNYAVAPKIPLLHRL
ncbi:MAG: TMEM175 family protein [Candidatus Dormibacteraeota bacterium]|nr:TMEM175 family protein [Candidatus Dormibacteraeota bacterium]